MAVGDNVWVGNEERWKVAFRCVEPGSDFPSIMFIDVPDMSIVRNGFRIDGKFTVAKNGLPKYISAISNLPPRKVGDTIPANRSKLDVEILPGAIISATRWYAEPSIIKG